MCVFGVCFVFNADLFRLSLTIFKALFNKIKLKFKSIKQKLTGLKNKTKLIIQFIIYMYIQFFI